LDLLILFFVIEGLFDLGSGSNEDASKKKLTEIKNKVVNAGEKKLEEKKEEKKDGKEVKEVKQVVDKKQVPLKDQKKKT